MPRPASQPVPIEMSCLPVPRMPTCDEHPVPCRKRRKFGKFAALAGVLRMNLMTVFCSQCAMASCTRCWSGIAGSISYGACPPGQRNWLPGRMTPCSRPSLRIAAVAASTSSTLPRSISPSKMARPSTTAYWTAFGPNVRPAMIAVPTSVEVSVSGLSDPPDPLFLDTDFLLVLLRVVLFLAVLLLAPPPGVSDMPLTPCTWQTDGHVGGGHRTDPPACRSRRQRHPRRRLRPGNR